MDVTASLLFVLVPVKLFSRGSADGRARLPFYGPLLLSALRIVATVIVTRLVSSLNSLI